MMTIKRSVEIRDDQKEWVRKHPILNLSGFFREKIDELIKLGENESIVDSYEREPLKGKHKVVKVVYYIRDDQDEWLRKHPSINDDYLLREKLDELMAKDSPP